MKKYEDSIGRVEFRWDHPPEIETVEKTVQTMKNAGVTGWVSSGVSGKGVPLYPSSVMPWSHEKANKTWLEYLLKRAAEEEIAVISWYPFNMSAPVTDRFPEYRMQFLDFPYQRNLEWEGYYACLNSPYMDYLEGIIKEQIRIGFKGIWFDGNTFSNHNTYPMFQPGCCCRYCSNLFMQDTGEKIPQAVDFASDTFRLWINWRYDNMVRVWTRLLNAAHSIDKNATICLNNYRRRHPKGLLLDWNTGIPLRKLNLDLVVSSELDGFNAQADFQIKLGQAMKCTRGCETWLPLRIYENAWIGNPEIETMIHGAAGAFSAGGSVFSGTANLDSIGYAMKDVVNLLEPVNDQREKEMIKYAGIWVSQKSMDFARGISPATFWNAYHGTNELLNHAHLPTSIIFDDSVESSDVSDYKVIIGGSNTCISDRDFVNLLTYVENGGLLVTCSEFAKKDENGIDRTFNPLYKVIGITGESCICPMAYSDISAKYAIMNQVKSFFGGSSYIKITTDIGFDGNIIAFSQIAREINECPGIITKSYGKGHILYFNSDVFQTYLTNPTTFIKELIDKLIRDLNEPLIDIIAPMCITTNLFLRDNGYALQLHNNPGGTYRYPNSCSSIGEILPVYNIKINISRLGIKKAYLLREKMKLPIENGFIHIKCIKHHQTVLLLTKIDE
jgi:hypothetical protein